MRFNQDYKNAALAALKGKWAYAVIASVIYVLIAFLCTGNDTIGKLLHFQPGLLYTLTGASLLITFFVYMPLTAGYDNAMRKNLDTGDYSFTSNMFGIALDGYLHKVWTLFLMEVKILLWALLLIVPGIIKSFAYAMTPYILVDHPEYSASEAIAASEEMMKGHKFDLFWLYLSFIGWIFLAIITCGIGFFWLMPYITSAQAGFYNDLKGTDTIIVSE